MPRQAAPRKGLAGFILPLLLGLLAACTSTAPVTPPPTPVENPGMTLSASPLPVPVPPPPVAKEPPPPPQALLHSRHLEVEANGISMHVFLCDDRLVEFSIADQANGPGTEWKSAAQLGQRSGALAAINGGFFTPEGDPLGLVVEKGSRYGHWNKSSSLTSGVFAVSEGSPRLQRSSQWTLPTSARHLLQTGPFLVERGKAVSGLSKAPSRPRSFLLWDGRHHWAFGYAKSGSLASLAQTLARQPIPNFPIKSGLNLDGGSSSQLWISGQVKGDSGLFRPLWTKSARNYLLARPKP